MADYYQPERDASLGLIFRLNALWEKSDRRALSGDLNAWELVLDRIFSNLLYREEVDIEKVFWGADQNVHVWSKIKKNIKLAKVEIIKARRERDVVKLNLAKEKHYNAVMFYDIWLRKYMQYLKLYLKETESNPSKALFGGAFGKKKF